MKQYYGQQATEYAPLPPLFAARVRVGSLVTGVALLIGTAFVLGLTAFVNRPLHGHSLPDSPVGVLGLLLPTLSVVATAVVVLSCRGCLQGDYLVVARARAARKALAACFTALVVASLFALTASALVDLWSDHDRLGATDLLATFANFALGVLGYAVGLFYVRPSVSTLEKFSDHPIW
ncbi:hypothetical protein [Amycolatopsis sp. FDAARGOS 1241]|uniref:hypothetical protein n=1 Tax=Amycolatopsis sp. FDAARGOS 1241 TaxID=2778070 RepID=UPI00194EFA5C|nr:hypothetical protein [Amycolatopsis sp. FDAARGOS 1241]QRP46641.1 hypothetical protein I6J71_00735 [Amycolatopsis sp. FDAARGOS 1241]